MMNVESNKISVPDGEKHDGSQEERQEQETFAYPAVEDFGHDSWKGCLSFTVGQLDESTGLVASVDVSTVDMGLRCHDLDRGAAIVRPLPPSTALRPPDRDGVRRPLQPGEVPSDAVTRWADDKQSRRPWYVPFQVMPNLDGHPALFDRWERNFLGLVNDHRLVDTPAVDTLGHAHRVLPHPGTRGFGMDLTQEPQRWLADRLSSEWAGEEPPVFLDVYTDTIRRVVVPYMARHYGTTRFHVQKHPKNLRLQLPGMKSVQHWHCDRMFGHQREINFFLCLSDFTSRGAGIAMEVEPGVAHPIVAGAGSVVTAPFGYKPHGNVVNAERDHTRVSLDWRVVPGGMMQSKDEVGASATSHLLYAEGEYFAEWDAELGGAGSGGGWVVPPRPHRPVTPEN